MVIYANSLMLGYSPLMDKRLVIAATLLIAGVMHVPKRGKNAQEQLATWTPIIKAAGIEMD